MSFQDALALALQEEGGYTLSDLLGDTGKSTYAGISRANWPQWVGWPLIDAGDRGSAQLKALVENFYLKTFWQPLQGDQLPSRVATLVFDFAINAGLLAGAKALQRAALVQPDGAIGAITVAAVTKAEPERLLRLLFAEQLAYYTVCNNWPAFGRGWINRVIDEMRRL